MLLPQVTSKGGNDVCPIQVDIKASQRLASFSSSSSCSLLSAALGASDLHF